MSKNFMDGYSGRDSMREKAKKLFGEALSNDGLDIVPSASAPSKTPMRKYAKGGSVAKAPGKRTGSMLPKTASEPVEGGALTDLHMPKKLNAANMKKGGTVKPRAKVTSPMRKAVRGAMKGTDQKIKGDSLDVGSIPQVAVPKKSTMLKPKPASNGRAKTPLNVESTKEFAAMKKGGSAKAKMNGMKSVGKCK